MSHLSYKLTTILKLITYDIMEDNTKNIFLFYFSTDSHHRNALNTDVIFLYQSFKYCAEQRFFPDKISHGDASFVLANVITD